MEKKKKKLIIQTIYWFSLLSIYMYMCVCILRLDLWKYFAIKKYVDRGLPMNEYLFNIYWYIPSAQDAMNFPLLEKFMSRTGPVCPLRAPTTQECVNSCCVSRLFLFLARLLVPPAAPIDPLVESLDSSNFTLSDSVTSKRTNIYVYIYISITAHYFERK